MADAMVMGLSLLPQTHPCVGYTVLWYQLEGGQSEEDQIITVEMSAGFSSTFKLVPENCAS